LAGRFSSVTEFTLPTEVKAGVEIPFTVSGHLDSVPSPDWPNFALALFYDKGPMSEIEIVVDGQSFTLKPRTCVVNWTAPRPSPCSTLKMDCRIKRLEAGSYSFSALTGYLEGSYFYYDDKVVKAVEAKAEAVWPWWWPLAAVGGGVGLIAVIGAIAYEERRREEELMLMLARR
jgi:hypothetical protein